MQNKHTTFINSVLPIGEITLKEALKDRAKRVPKVSINDPRGAFVWKIGQGDPDAEFKKEIEDAMFKDFYERNGIWFERNPYEKDRRANPKRARREQGHLYYDDVKEWVIHFTAHGGHTDADIVRKILAAPNYDREQIMEPRFYKYWQKLPDMVPVFRGSKGGLEGVEAPSWSLTLDEAERFALGNRPEERDKSVTVRLFKAYIPKDAILTIDNLIGEAEVILDPHKLTDVKLVINEDKGFLGRMPEGMVSEATLLECSKKMPMCHLYSAP